MTIKNIASKIAVAMGRDDPPSIKPGPHQIAEAKRRMERELRGSGYSRNAAKTAVSRAFARRDG